MTLTLSYYLAYIFHDTYMHFLLMGFKVIDNSESQHLMCYGVSMTRMVCDLVSNSSEQIVPITFN